jgi:hypothetical protein
VSEARRCARRRRRSAASRYPRGAGLSRACIAFERDFAVYEIETCVEMLLLVGHAGVCIQ